MLAIWGEIFLVHFGKFEHHFLFDIVLLVLDTGKVEDLSDCIFSFFLYAGTGFNNFKNLSDYLSN